MIYTFVVTMEFEPVETYMPAELEHVAEQLADVAREHTDQVTVTFTEGQEVPDGEADD
jgi:adenylosuccinate lyase